MVLADYSREWKKYQRDFVRLQIQKTHSDMQQVTVSGPRQARRNSTSSFSRPARSSSRTKRRSRKPEEDQRSEREALRRRRELPVRESPCTTAKSTNTKKRSPTKPPTRRNSATKLKETEKEMNDYKAELDKTTLDLSAANEELDKYVGQRNALQKERESLLSGLHTGSRRD